MDLKTFELLARYNVWSTQKLNQVLRNVSNDDFNADCGLYFKSIAGTLNHLLIGEHYLWFPRFLAKPSPILKLNTIIENDKDKLIFQLEDKVGNWINFLQCVDIEKFKYDLQYKTSTGKEMSLPYAETLLHVFNHGTHHRGQVTAALTSMGYDCPELDLVYMLIEENHHI
ncbi:DinB family protein [Acinetobacter calcoaceticus]|uniref:Damage-inducible protein DinB n=1 Tax=Acinetobacter calcoaceticus TaxID=471 RepID=A0ABD5ARZ7_ACICA|nr:DinB family protein [Acinetobacter calcoaceticus]MDP9805073.1 putative damage-inducible protein DinB [Acinetobacter calcoaceticus]